MFFITVAILLVFPVLEFISIGKKLELNQFYHLLENGSIIRDNIKIFATHGLLIALLGFVLFITFIIYWFNRKQIWARNILLLVMMFLLLGGLGPYYCSFGKYKIYEIAANMDFQESGVVQANVQFKGLSEKFKEYLKAASLGKIRCSLSTHLVLNGENVPITINNANGSVLKLRDRENIPLSSEFITSFLINPSVQVELMLKESQKLIYRDLKQSLTPDRTDQIQINHKVVPIPNNQGLLIYFKFEDKDGKPLAVFL